MIAQDYFCDMGKGSSVVNLKDHETRVKDGKTRPEKRLKNPSVIRLFTLILLV